MPKVLDTPVTKLLSAIRVRLVTVPGLPPANLRAWENIVFEPPDPPVMYVEDHWLGGPEGSAAVGQDLYRGTYLYQVNVMAPGGSGVHTGMTLADNIGKAFRTPPTLPITGSQYPALVLQVRIGPSLSRAPSWWVLPVSLSIDMDF